MMKKKLKTTNHINVSNYYSKLITYILYAKYGYCYRKNQKKIFNEK